MAENKTKPKFPSPANTPKNAKKAPEVKEEKKIVEGKAQELISINYKKDNHLVIHGVHAIRTGMNSFPKSVWDAHKSAPAIQALIATGDLEPIEDISDHFTKEEMADITGETAELAAIKAAEQDEMETALDSEDSK